MRANNTYIFLRRATPETRHWATPRDPPSIGHLSASDGRPSTLHWAPIRVSVCPARLVGIVGHPRRSVGPLQHRIFFIRFTTYGSYHPFSRKFIHCPQNASTFQKINQLFRNFILCREISSSVQKVYLLRNKFILSLPNSSTMPFLE
jgi:hypothetical protein